MTGSRNAIAMCATVVLVVSASACGGSSKSGTSKHVSTVASSKAINEAGRHYKPIPIKGQVVKVYEGIPDDNSITLSPDHVRKGIVTFEVVNDSGVAHDFEIAGKKTGILAEEETAVLTVDFSRPGNYVYRSRMGQAPGTLRVTG